MRDRSSRDRGTSMDIRDFFPEIEPYRTKRLKVSDLHTIYVEEVGNQEGASYVFPDAWEKYLAPIPEAERGDLVGAYYRRLTGDNEEERLRCAIAWSKWEASTMYLIPNEASIREHEEPKAALSLARIE